MGEGDVVVPGRFDRSPTLGNLAAAMARAQQAFAAIGKDKTASVASKRTGQTFTYDYADLATCLAAVMPALSKEALALFQPVTIEVDKAVATTLLVHESGEWMSSDFAVTIVDPTDARSIGSAATYGRRYGLLGMLAVAPSGEDDDAEEARGGAHEQAASKSEPACPVCGMVGSLMRGAAQYGGGSLCWVKKSGCGTKWPEGTPFPPTEKPPIDPDPAPGSRRAKAAPAQRQAAKAPVVEPPVVDPPATGSEDCAIEGCWGPKGHPGDHVFDPDNAGVGGGSTQAPETGSAPEPAEVPPVTRFTIGKSLIETAGMTQEQFEESVKLSTVIDKGPLGKGYAREILGKILGKPTMESSRKELTEALATRYLFALTQAAAVKTPEQARPFKDGQGELEP